MRESWLLCQSTSKSPVKLLCWQRRSGHCLHKNRVDLVRSQSHHQTQPEAKQTSSTTTVFLSAHWPLEYFVKDEFIQPGRIYQALAVATHDVLYQESHDVAAGHSTGDGTSPNEPQDLRIKSSVPLSSVHQQIGYRCCVSHSDTATVYRRSDP